MNDRLILLNIIIKSQYYFQIFHHKLKISHCPYVLFMLKLTFNQDYSITRVTGLVIFKDCLD